MLQEPTNYNELAFILVTIEARRTYEIETSVF